MIDRLPFRRLAATTMVVALAMLVSACFLAPGKFTSGLDVRKDRTFSFTYSGELYLLPMRQASKKSVFTPESCYDSETGAERDCTSDEKTQQKVDWEQKQKQQKSESASAAAMFGGIDPSDPRAAEEIAAKLRRQTGWRKVEYKGDGLYLVDFAIAGKLDHDFTFPTFEGFAMSNAFVQISQRSDGSVRIDAPGYGPAVSGLLAGGLMQAASSSSNDGKPGGGEGMPVAEGTFTVTTNAGILANNTDEGANAGTVGQVLSWKSSARTTAAPTALLQLQK